MSEEKKINKFFVYGTLKEGRPLDRKGFADLRVKVQEATIVGNIYNLGWYPTIKLDGKGIVVGEVHTFPEKHAEDIRGMMDRIEGYNAARPSQGLYNRHMVKATLADGKVVTAWAYEFNGSVKNAELLEDGVWEPSE